MGRLRRTWLLLVLAAPAAAQEGKLDRDLDDQKRHHPVFVRMADQLFARGGEFEAFCRRNERRARSAVRQEALAALRDKGARSWERIAPAVAELEESGAVRDVRRFWIVNGFACDATGAACRALAGRPEVAFVYRQRQPGGRLQHRDLPRGERWRRARRADLERALALHDPEEGPFEADGLRVPWNLRRIGAEKAWAAGALGQGVVVALCDSGLLVAPPLVAALWRNDAEQPNGEDDDGNGLADDLFGWDFEGDTPYCLGDGPLSHGTMCGGILAARPGGEPRTVTGVAPRARLMVLRGAGSLRAYEYAAAQGADVFSMSYMWVNVELGHYRGLFRTAHEHLAACGVVAVGGAGNFRRSAPPGRQIALPKDIPCVIAAAGIVRGDRQAPLSSEGPCTWQGVAFFDDYPPEAPLRKPDVTGVFGGYPIWHWTAGVRRGARVVWEGEDGVGLIVGPGGNSFSGPHAGGVAALMLSARPELTPWRLKALMEATCEDLGPPGHDPGFGAGLLRADAAVAAARAAEIDG